MVRVSGFKRTGMEPRISLVTLVLSLLCVAVIEMAARLVETGRLIPPLILVGLARVAEIGLLATLVARNPLSWSALGLTPGLAARSIGTGIKTGLIWAAGCGAVAASVLLAMFLGGLRWQQYFSSRLPLSDSDLVWFLVVGGLISPVAEELFFRGMLYGYLRRWGFVSALLLSTAVFVLAHQSWPTISVQQIVGGLVFALAYEVTGNLLTPIIIHVLGNLTLFALSWAIRHHLV